MPTTTEVQYPFRKRETVVKASGRLIEIATLPGEDPLILGRCNYDTVSPKRHRDVSVMGRGVADEAIGDVKLVADEVMVT